MKNRAGSHLKQNSHLPKSGKRAKFNSKDEAIKVIACVLILTTLPLHSTFIMRENNEVEFVENISYEDSYSFNQGNHEFDTLTGVELVNYFVNEFEKRGLNNKDKSSIDEEIFKILFDDLKGLSNVDDQVSYLRREL